MDLKNIKRRLKRAISERKILSILIAIVVFVGIIMAFTFTVKAYPDWWDRYDHMTENQDIFNTEKEKMDAYDPNYSYDIVPADSDENNIQGHGSSYQYTNMTINEATNPKQITKWFISPYGPYMDYATTLTPGEAESTSLKFNSDNKTYSNSNYAYVGSGDSDGELGDIKSAAMIHYNEKNLYPLIINSNHDSISSNITTELPTHNIKNIIMLGGGQRYDMLLGIGGMFNIVRIGGQERNMTYHYLQLAEQAKDTIYNVSQKPPVGLDGVICDIKTTQISKYNQAKIKSLLSTNTKDGFNDAAKLALENIQYGGDSNISNGSYEVLIGCKYSPSSTKSMFLKVYMIYNANGVQYGVYQYIGQDYQYDNNVSPTPVDPPQPTGPLPTATIYAPTQVPVGDDVTLTATGHVDDNKVTTMLGDIYFNNSFYIMVNNLNEFHRDFIDVNSSRSMVWNGSVWFSQEGAYTAHSTVFDSNGNFANSSDIQIQAIPPIPYVALKKTGPEEENRRMVIDASGSSSGSKRFSIDWSKAKWTVRAVPGGNNTDKDIRIQEHAADMTNNTPLWDIDQGLHKSLDGLKTFDVSFEKVGQYEISCSLTNNYKEGKTATATIYVNILPDQEPIAHLYGASPVYRDPLNKNIATFPLWSEASSPDGDIIDDVVYVYAFNEDNNHWWDHKLMDFSYMTWYVLNNSTGEWQAIGDEKAARALEINKFPIGTKMDAQLLRRHVGTYRFVVIVREHPTHDYIPQFFRPRDAKIGTTWDNVN